MSDYTRLPSLHEISTLPAGKTLDALVAAHIFGWTWDAKTSEWTSPEGFRFGLTPFFSDTIHMAWPIHERMLDRVDDAMDLLAQWALDRISSSLQMPQSPLGSSDWVVRLNAERYAALILAPTAPLSICRAALWVAAVEAEGSDG